MLRARLAAAETKIEAWKIVLDFMFLPYYTPNNRWIQTKGGEYKMHSPPFVVETNSLVRVA